jgi:uncharacterized protein (TIGR03435 family)
VTTQVAAGLVVVAAFSALGAAQEQSTAAQAKAFEVASVHPNTSGTAQTNINFTPGGVTFTNLQLRAIIQFAYGISQPSRLAGVPDWANNERFDVVARGVVASLQDRRVMLQALLADRFKLAAHAEQRSLPIYTLTLARSDGKLGPWLKPSAADCAAQRCGVRPGGPGEVNLTGVQISAFAAMLSITQGRTVVDGTALTGTYDIQLTFAPDTPAGRAADASVVPEGRPSIFTALQEQLGLKLQAGNRLEAVLVIDRVSHPDEN